MLVTSDGILNCSQSQGLILRAVRGARSTTARVNRIKRRQAANEKGLRTSARSPVVRTVVMLLRRSASPKPTPPRRAAPGAGMTLPSIMEAETNWAVQGFTAMSMYKLGHKEEAIAVLGKLRSLFKDDRVADSRAAHAVLAEAEELIAGEKP